MRNPFRRTEPSPGRTPPAAVDSRLNDALAAIAGATTPHDALAALATTARGAIGSDGITLIGRIGDEVEYLTEDAISPLWTGQRFPIRTCISGQALLARAPIFIPDIAVDRRVPLNAYLATFVQSMGVVPIGRGDAQFALGAYWQVAQPIAPLAIERMLTLADAAAAVIGRDDSDRDGRQVA